MLRTKEKAKIKKKKKVAFSYELKLYTKSCKQFIGAVSTINVLF